MEVPLTSVGFLYTETFLSVVVDRVRIKLTQQHCKCHSPVLEHGSPLFFLLPRQVTILEPLDYESISLPIEIRGIVSRSRGSNSLYFGLEDRCTTNYASPA